MKCRFHLCFAAALTLTLGGLSAQVQALLPRRVPESERERIRNLGERIGDLIERKEYGSARKVLEEAVSIDPNNSQAMSLLAAVAIYEKKFDEAEKIYGELMKNEPDNMSLIWNSAEIDFLRGNYAKARERLEILRKRNPLDEMITYKIGLTFLFEGKTHEAQAEIEKIRFPSNTAAYYYGRAAIDLTAGRKEEGLRWTSEAARIFSFKHNALFADSLVEKRLLTTADIINKGGIEGSPMPGPLPGPMPALSGSEPASEPVHAPTP